MRIIVVALLLALSTVGTVSAQVVGKTGDLLVTNGRAQSVLLIDPATGQQTLLLQGQDLPSGIATNVLGDVVFTDNGDGPSGYSYGRVTQLLGVGNWLDLVKPEYNPFGCYLEDNGDVVYVRQRNPGLYRYSAATGTVTYGFSPNFANVRHIAKEPYGNLLVVDEHSSSAIPHGDGAIYRFTATLALLGVVSQSGLLKDPTGIAVDAVGWIYVVDKNGTAPGVVVRVDPTDGTQTLVSSGGNLVDPTGVALARDGSLVVTDLGTGGAPRVLRVDPTTGLQSTISVGGLLVDPQGVAVILADPPVSIRASSWGRLKGLYR